MPQTSKKKSGTKKRASKRSTGAKRAKVPLPQVSLTSELSLDLYAASRYLDSDAEERLHLIIPFDVILQDPQVLEENPGLATDDKFNVRWEPGIIDGPTSARFAVVDYNRDTGQLVPPATWDPELRKFCLDGKELTTKNMDVPQFHQVNVWAVIQNALAFYEGGFGLGRRIPWGFEGNRLIVVPHAGNGQNAFYDRESKSLQFYYFGEGKDRVYTCLSADIVYHEFGHAVLDGVRPYFSEGASVQSGAFHEFMGDISAILMSLRNKKFRQTIASQTKGDISAAKNLTSIAEQFGKKTENREYLRTAVNNAKMKHMVGQTSVHLVSQVMTGTMFDILKALTGKYLEREQKRFKEGATRQKPSVKRVFWNAIQRMQRMTIQPLDLLPPVDVKFRDYALAVLRAEQMADPLDPNDYFGMMLEIFVKRGILDEADREALTEDRYLLERQKLRVYHDIDEISRSRAAAYRFLHDNREDLYIPLGTDFIVADLYDANKYNRAGLRLPRQIVLLYVWREDVVLEGERFESYQGKITTLLCGGTIVFDDKGNILSWARKPGASMKADEERLGWPKRRKSKIKQAWYDELAEGERRRQALLDDIAARIASGQIGPAAAGPKGLIGTRLPPVTAEVGGDAVEFKKSPHLKIADDDPDEDSGGRQWQISF